VARSTGSARASSRPTTSSGRFFEGIFQKGRWPVGIYPDWLKFGIIFLEPIAFAITVPAEAVTSRLDWQTLAFAAVFTVAAFGFARWFWRYGLRNYPGASA